MKILYILFLLIIGAKLLDAQEPTHGYGYDEANDRYYVLTEQDDSYKLHIRKDLDSPDLSTIEVPDSIQPSYEGRIWGHGDYILIELRDNKFQRLQDGIWDQVSVSAYQDLDIDSEKIYILSNDTLKIYDYGFSLLESHSAKGWSKFTLGSEADNVIFASKESMGVYGVNNREVVSSSPVVINDYDLRAVEITDEGSGIYIDMTERPLGDPNPHLIYFFKDGNVTNSFLPTYQHPFVATHYYSFGRYFEIRSRDYLLTPFPHDDVSIDIVSPEYLSYQVGDSTIIKGKIKGPSDSCYVILNGASIPMEMNGDEASVTIPIGIGERHKFQLFSKYESFLNRSPASQFNTGMPVPIHVKPGYQGERVLPEFTLQYLAEHTDRINIAVSQDSTFPEANTQFEEFSITTKNATLSMDGLENGAKYYTKARAASEDGIWSNWTEPMMFIVDVNASVQELGKRDMMTILSEALGRKATVTLTDMGGRQIEISELRTLEDLPRGVYMINVASAGEHNTYKFHSP